MVFSTPVFVFLFLPLALLLHAVAGRHLRNSALLLVSLLFYAWGSSYDVLLMLATIGANWGFGLWIERVRAHSPSRLPVTLATVFNLSVLAFYKYTNWAWENLVAMFAAWDLPTAWLGQSPGVHMPLGISFFIFHALSAVIDVHRGEARVTKNPLDFGLYIACFPQLVAGPIVRYHDVAEQLYSRRVTLDGFAYGVRRFVVGLGKKVLIANSTGLLVDEIFGLPPEQLTFAAAWLGVIGWSIQLYFDFSGYSDMAIGLARMFGFTYRENFEHPYISRSITEFWRRWHISLSSFFRDYLYIPLGGNRRGPLRTYVNLVTVFLLTGMWHGAAWTFVVWGAYHGTLLIVERVAFGRWLAGHPLLAHVYFFFAVTVGWAIFRADDLPYAAEIVRSMFDPFAASTRIHPAVLFLNGERVAALLAGCVCMFPWVQWARRWHEQPKRAPAFGRLSIAADFGLVLTFGASLLAVAAGTFNPFIYFRF